MKKIILLSVLSIFLLSCSSTNSIRGIKKVNEKEINKNLEEYSEVKDSISKGEKILPSKEEWLADRNEFTNKIQEYLDDNKEIKDKSRKTNNFLTISGTGIGVLGGLYGFTNDNEEVITSLSSIVVGGLTTVISTLNLKKRQERAESCNDFLNIILLDFKFKWGEVAYPRTEDELKNYITAKDEIINRIKEMKCFN